MGIPIDYDTGLVRDTQVVSNYWAAYAKDPKPNFPGYEQWFREHKINGLKNFESSSNAMEVEAVKAYLRPICSKAWSGLWDDAVRWRFQGL